MTEAPGLQPVTVDSDRLVGQRLPDEAWNDHAIRRALTRTDSVEESCDDGRQTALLVIQVRKNLVDRFGDGVGPTPHLRRAENPISILGK